MTIEVQSCRKYFHCVKHSRLGFFDSQFNTQVCRFGKLKILTDGTQQTTPCCITFGSRIYFFYSYWVTGEKHYIELARKIVFGSHFDTLHSYSCYYGFALIEKNFAISQYLTYFLLEKTRHVIVFQKTTISFFWSVAIQNYVKLCTQFIVYCKILAVNHNS